MDPNRTMTSFRPATTRASSAPLVGTLIVAVFFAAAATAQCGDFVADLWTTPWDSLGAFTSTSSIPSLSAFSVDGGNTLTTFDSLFDLKVTGQAYREQQPYNPDGLAHLRIDGVVLFFNVDGYLVIEFETEGVSLSRNVGRFTITAAGGVYSGTTGSGVVEIWMFNSPYEHGAHVDFTSDLSF